MIDKGLESRLYKVVPGTEKQMSHKTIIETNWKGTLQKEKYEWPKNTWRGENFTGSDESEYSNHSGFHLNQLAQVEVSNRSDKDMKQVKLYLCYNSYLYRINLNDTRFREKTFSFFKVRKQTHNAGGGYLLSQGTGVISEGVT